MLEQTHVLLKQAQSEVNHALEAYLQPAEPELLWQAMEYSLLGGGKRIRPLICLFTCRALSGHWQDALPAACALEMIHAYSLIHDDLPALDNDDWRRGKPSNHRRFGEAMAILAGDALTALAFEIISRPAKVLPEQQLKVMAELASAAGPGGMCGGQVLDMQSSVEQAEQILQVYALKTGALFRAAVRMGAILGGADASQLQALTIYAEQLGQAFQLVDDLLDLSGSLDSLGKTPGKDQAQAKRTYPALMGLEATQERVAQCLECALAALQTATLKETAALVDLAHLLVERTA